MLQTILTKVFGTKSDRDTKALIPIVDEINTIYETLQAKSDDDLIKRTGEFKLEVASAREVAEKYAKEKISDNDEADKYVLNAEHDKLDEILPEAFAMVKEVCRRTMGKSWRIMGQENSWDMIPYDVQILGGIVLHSGKVTEMKTGEGKTLVATMPLYLNALSSRGAHLVTVNDYLAQRDAEWMGEIYKHLGLTVGFILNTMDNRERQDAYNCDITYGTNNEFGFDYLRDNMALAPEDQVQRDHAFVIVDEVDSVLIDEARTPLIISGSVDAPVDTTYKELKPLVQNLIKKQVSLVTEMVAEATRYIDQENNDEAGLKLLQANRGMPKHPKLLKIFQEKGTKKLAHDVESEYMRDKKIHEVDEDLFFSIDEKTHVIDITEKGRESLAPNDPDMFVIPDLGEMLHEIDVKENLSSLEIKQEKEKVHQQHAEQSGRIHNISQTKEKVLDDLFIRNSYDGETKVFITELYGNIVDNKIWAEQLISDNLDNWKLERVATLDQLIMRIAVNEIYFNDDIPPKVSISEAIEIAKLYSTEDSAGFVNGVLDAIYKHKLNSDKTT